MSNIFGCWSEFTSQSFIHINRTWIEIKIKLRISQKAKIAAESNEVKFSLNFSWLRLSIRRLILRSRWSFERKLFRTRKFIDKIALLSCLRFARTHRIIPRIQGILNPACSRNMFEYNVQPRKLRYAHTI